MCNLRCVFCQNWDISQRREGQDMDPAGLAEWMMQLQAAGCHNINFVTPEHVAPQVGHHMDSWQLAGLDAAVHQFLCVVRFKMVQMLSQSTLRPCTM